MNLEPESTSINSPDNSIRWFGALRSRYHAFLEKYKEPASPSRRARFGRRALRFATFSALVVAILAVFWIGLSWFGIGSQKAKVDQLERSAERSAEQPAKQSANPSANPSTNPAANPSASKPAGAKASIHFPPELFQPEGPAGHAEVISRPAPGKKTDGQ